jgi:F0F1-type ATP synthase membrane subunit b/b'
VRVFAEMELSSILWDIFTFCLVSWFLPSFGFYPIIPPF